MRNLISLIIKRLKNPSKKSGNFSIIEGRWLVKGELTKPTRHKTSGNYRKKFDITPPIYNPRGGSLASFFWPLTNTHLLKRPIP
jgi:hypothetical protein